MPNKNLHLSRTTCARLGRLKNASAYVEQLVANGWPRAEEAVRVLQRAGWTAQEILEACAPQTGVTDIGTALVLVERELSSGNTHIEELINGDDQ